MAMRSQNAWRLRRYVANCVGLLICAAFVAGCATTQVTLQDAPQQVAAQATAYPNVVDWTDASSTLFGFPRIEKALAPLAKRCELTGVTPRIERETFVFKPTSNTDTGKAVPGPRHAIQYTLPARLLCMAPDGQPASDSWAFEFSYKHQYKWFMAGENKLMDIWIKPSFVSGEELAKRAESKRIAAEYAKLRKEQLNAAAQAQERDMAEYVQRKNAERQARTPAFRQNVKAGDRMRLASGGSESTGLVVEVKRPLVLVQFDRMTVNNESKRWIKIEDIEPGQ
jgi:hypothetical protein